jgi:sterol desaturase/sphingolipid hydroxylase (fatty acid hydroxylase superfamily)
MSEVRNITMTSITMLASWVVGSCISAELLGYWLHRLLHSGAVGFLSRNHMRHHMVHYGPLQKQRSREYHDSTTDSLSLGNVGVEWLIPAAVIIAGLAVLLHILHIQLTYALIYLGAILGWSFLMFSYLHDVMHVEGAWLERNGWLRRWFVAARKRHAIHHCMIDDRGLMNKNFGIGFFFFDRLFGTLAECGATFNHNGYSAARERFKSVLGGEERTTCK